MATRLAERITALEQATAATFIEPIVRQLATAHDPVGMWRNLPLAARREFIRAVMTIQVKRVTSRWHAKEAGVVISPRRNTLQYTTFDGFENTTDVRQKLATGTKPR